MLIPVGTHLVSPYAVIRISVCPKSGKGQTRQVYLMDGNSFYATEEEVALLIAEINAPLSTYTNAAASETKSKPFRLDPPPYTRYPATESLEEFESRKSIA